MSLPKRVKVYEALLALDAGDFVSVGRIARRAHVPIGTASYELCKLEDSRLVMRLGLRGGWRPDFIYADVYRHLLDVYRRTHAHVPLSSFVFSLNLDRRVVWAYLKVLKGAGLVVSGKRGYYKPVRHADVIPAGAKVLATLSDLYFSCSDFVSTPVIANELNVNARYVRRNLAALEAEGRVVRRGERGGWKPVYV